MSFKPISIDENEARVLARHWAKEYEELDRFYAAFDCWGGAYTRAHVRAANCMQALCDAGLLTEQECRDIFREAREANADFWAAFEAAGQVVGFLHPG